MNTKITLHDEIIVTDKRHPLCGCVGKVVGIRGKTAEGYNWLLVYFPQHFRSYLVPENFCKKDEMWQS